MFHRRESAVDVPNAVKVLVGERADLGIIAENIKVDAVIDFVCGSAFDAQELVAAIRGRVGRLIVLSSADVYRAYDIMTGYDDSQRQPTPIAEDGELRRKRYPYRHPYDPLYMNYAKVLVEQTILQASDFETTVLRMPVVYGFGEIPHPIRTALMQMNAGVKIVLFDGASAAWKGCWTYIENVIAAITVVLERGRTARRIYNIADSNPPTVWEWLEQFGVQCGWKGALLPAPRWQLRSDCLVVPNPQQNWHIDAGLIRDEFGFTEPVGWSEAIARTISSQRLDWQ